MKKTSAGSKSKNICEVPPRIHDVPSLLQLFNKLSESPRLPAGLTLQKFTSNTIRDRILNEKLPIIRRGEIQGWLLLLPKGSSLKGDFVVEAPWSLVKSAGSRGTNHEKILLQRAKISDGNDLVFIPEKYLNAFGIISSNQKTSIQPQGVLPFRKRTGADSVAENPAKDMPAPPVAR